MDRDCENGRHDRDTHAAEHYFLFCRAHRAIRERGQQRGGQREHGNARGGEADRLGRRKDGAFVFFEFHHLDDRQREGGEGVGGDRDRRDHMVRKGPAPVDHKENDQRERKVHQKEDPAAGAVFQKLAFLPLPGRITLGV